MGHDDSLFNFDRGMAYYDKGDYDSALSDFTKCVNFFNGNSRYDYFFYWRALTYYKKRDYDRAWADLKKYRQLGGTVEPSFLENLRNASGRSE